MDQMDPNILMAMLQQMQAKQNNQKPPKATGFKRVLNCVGAVLDSAIGGLLGFLGGAIVGPAKAAALGVEGGARNLIDQPWTIHYDRTKKRGYTYHGNDMHEAHSDEEKADVEIEEVDEDTSTQQERIEQRFRSLGLRQ